VGLTTSGYEGQK